MKKIKVALVALTTVSLVLAGTPAIAAEDDLAGDAAQSVAAAVENHPLAEDAEIIAPEARDGVFVADSEAAQITVPRTVDMPIDVSPTGNWAGALTGISVGLPEPVQGAATEVADDGSVVADGDGVQAVVQTLEGGLRLSTVIDGPSAPTSFAYELPEDLDITLNEDGSATLSRTATGLDEEGNEVSFTAEVGYVGAPWAADADGSEIETRYEVVGNELIQYVEHGPGTSYPVVADPTFWWGWNVYASNTVVSQITKLLLGGSSAALLASRITALIPAVGTLTTNVIALAGALLAFGAAAINACNWNNRGVYFGHTWVTGVLPFAPSIVRNGYFCVPN